MTDLDEHPQKVIHDVDYALSRYGDEYDEDRITRLLNERLEAMNALADREDHD